MFMSGERNAAGQTDRGEVLRKYDNFQIFWNDTTKLTWHARRDQEQFTVKECLLRFGVSFYFTTRITLYANRFARRRVGQRPQLFLSIGRAPRVQFNVLQLTLRRLMSYIYMEHPFLMFLDHTQRRSTVGRTPLDE